jgi:hypothetical protein
VAVDGLPLAILAAVEVGDPQGQRRDRAAVDGEDDVFVAEGVGQVPDGAGSHQFEAVVGEVENRVASQWKTWVTSSDPMTVRSAPNTVTGSWVDHIARRGSGSPLISACSASSWRARVGVRKSSRSLMATIPGRLGPVLP